MQRQLTTYATVLGVILGAQTCLPEAVAKDESREGSYSRSAPVYRFSGRMNDNTVEEFKADFKATEQARLELPWLLIHSQGGEADALIALSDFVDEQFAGVVVRRSCASACAELLMTIDKPVILGPSAEVKFHMSPVVAEKLLVRAAIPPPPCIARRAAWYRSNFRANLPVDAFAEEVITALAYVEGEPSIANQTEDCADYVFRSRGGFYIADLKALREITGGRISRWTQD